MNYIVIGCGRLGSQLAYRLFLRGYKVTVVDNNSAAFKNLPPDFLGRTIEGEATHYDIMHRAGIEQADGIAIVTNSDAVNAIVGHVARSVYNRSNVVVRNYDPVMLPMLQAFNLQTISSASWGAQRIEEMLHHSEIRAVFSAGNGEVEVYECKIPPGCAGQPLADLLPDHNCVPAGITRGGKAFIPTPETRLEKDDILVISATYEGIEALRKNLKAFEEAAQ